MFRDNKSFKVFMHLLIMIFHFNGLLKNLVILENVFLQINNSRKPCNYHTI